MDDQPTNPPVPAVGGHALPPPPAPPFASPQPARDDVGSLPGPTARPSSGRTRRIAAVTAVAAGVAITAGIAVAARDDTAASGTSGTTGDLPSIDTDGSTAAAPGQNPAAGLPELGAGVPGRDGHDRPGAPGGELPASDRRTGDSAAATPGQIPQGGAPDVSSQAS